LGSGEVRVSALGRAAGLLPASVRAPIQRRRRYNSTRSTLQSLLREQLGGRLYTAPDPGPVASSEVVSKTELMKLDELRRKSNRQVFLTSGMNAMSNFLRAGAKAGLDLEHATAAFELGTGGARLIRHLRGIEGMRLVASDLLDENVAWCRANLPDIEFYKNELEPPLSFAKDSEFDFAFAFSVFTHIPLNLQRPWIEELARILKPNGVAIVTVTGTEMAKFMMSEAEYDEFIERGDYTMGPDHPRVSASSKLIGYWDVFMTPQRVDELYGHAFEIVEHNPGRQSIVSLRKRS
jgi:SAM-dependent methyltransferase